MTDDTPFSKAELLRRIETGWAEFDAFVAGLTEERLAGPTDDAGWTAKDHLAHIAVWEAGMAALFRRRPRWEAMGVEREVLLEGAEAVNEVTQRHHRDKTVPEVLVMLRDGHADLIAVIESLSEEELQLPYRHYQPDSDREEPAWGWVVGNTYGHYAEHNPWIAAIVS